MLFRSLAAHELGYFRAGTEGCVLVAAEDRWWTPSDVRFVSDEAARHRLADLIGDLALAADAGTAGLPLGHVLAFNADADLHARFVRELVARTRDGDWVELAAAGGGGGGDGGGAP